MTELGMSLNEAWKKGGEPSLANRVQQFADAGILSPMLYDGLEELLLALRAQGADDGTESHIMNVMDRLSGWCHDSRIIVGKEKGTTVSVRSA